MQYVPLPRKLSRPGEVKCTDCNVWIYSSDKHGWDDDIYTTQMGAIEDHLCGQKHHRNSSHRKPRVRPPGDFSTLCESQ